MRVMSVMTVRLLETVGAEDRRSSSSKAAQTQNGRPHTYTLERSDYYSERFAPSALTVHRPLDR